MSIRNQYTVNQLASRLGWSPEEDALLFDAVRGARTGGAPLKSVFEEVAQQTGRKPNSIRNYYYERVKQGGCEGMELPHNPAFVPFNDEEIRSLLQTVLGARSRGVSVRACTLQMGEGDNRAMLRYQNKYRSLLKSNPELVKDVVRQMQEQGEATFDPYALSTKARRAGRPRKQSVNLLEVVGDVVNQLDRVEGLDVAAFFESLGALAVSAARGAQAQQTLQSLDDHDSALMVEENAELRAQLLNHRQELIAQRERFTTLLGYFRQLMNVNRDFLGLASVSKVSSLSAYIRELSRNVEDCERCLSESK